MPLKDVVSWKLVVGDLVNMDEKYFKQMSIRDLSSWTIMISEVSRVGHVVDARELFDGTPVRNVQAWNAMMVGYTENGDVPWTNMIVGYFEIGEVGSAIERFTSMPTRDTAAWNATIFGLSENDLGEEGLKLFTGMKDTAYRIHKNVEVGEITGERALDGEPDNSGVYLILADNVLLF
ncbi:pentatricopeptide repeat-containing protein At2g35030, mitochondrial-like [Pyrus communis]|uniref:pentatricopeptide repeat-containing protein At2g35030, mitochondrial-like n=1 Tax=Pyrus communis TaxID=23211 RepID=UPI0035C093D9